MLDSLTTISKFYAEAFAHYDRDRNPPPISVEFYPYIGINHTIRIRSGQAFVRLTELCREMPAEEHRSLAYILVSKLYRRKAPKWMRERYSNFIKSDEIRISSTESKRARGRKVLTGTTGSVYDLAEIFDNLNDRYFSGRLSKPSLTWSARKTYRILGHHDSTLDTIVISRSLDTIQTPRYVVEYVMFHEMLHVHHPTIHQNGRRYNHTAAFRRDEEKFEHFHIAERWIENNVRRLKRAAKRE
jgi:Predicted metal-dependent hydrolase